MATYLEKFKRASALNRRSFVRAGAAATVALAAGGSLVACSSPQEDDLAATGDNGASAETEGTWVTAACWHNCGGRCLNKVLVKDGRPVRQKTDDTRTAPTTPNSEAAYAVAASASRCLPKIASSIL